MSNYQERLKWHFKSSLSDLDLLIMSLILKIGYPASIKRNLMLMDSAKAKYDRIIIDVKVPSVTGNHVTKMLNVSYVQAFKYVVNSYADVEIFYKDDVKGWTKYEPQITIKEPFEKLEDIVKAKNVHIKKIIDGMRGESKILDDKLFISDKMKTAVTPFNECRHPRKDLSVDAVMSLSSAYKRMCIPCLVIHNTSAYSNRLEFNVDDYDAFIAMIEGSNYYIHTKLNLDNRVYRYPPSSEPVVSPKIYRNEENKTIVDLHFYGIKGNEMHIVLQHNPKNKILTGEFYFNDNKARIERTELMGIPSIGHIEFFKD